MSTFLHVIGFLLLIYITVIIIVGAAFPWIANGMSGNPQDEPLIGDLLGTFNDFMVIFNDFIGEIFVNLFLVFFYAVWFCIEFPSRESVGDLHRKIKGCCWPKPSDTTCT